MVTNRKNIMNNSKPPIVDLHRDYPELWSGIECSYTRMHDHFYDQIARAGHNERATDLKQIARLGIRVLRYPVLWEHHAGPNPDWSQADARMAEIRAWRMEPIVGLIHHGSGPLHTSLLDEKFPAGLAAHALEVARRYPWVKYYNPVNEPLTTARFSALYGIWYPHKSDSRSFLRALVTECQAVRESMRAIRTINPNAQLVQTEDVGYTFSTPLLAYQAEFENQRRWSSLDLLCGRLDAQHPLWNYFVENGITADELLSFVNDPCPPDIIGVNHYLTSERFLDERLELYPDNSHGGNGRHAYADIPAVRVSEAGTFGPYGVLRQTWERYHRTIAVTEAHLRCTREEQLRWLMEIWESAVRLRSEGCDIRAVTVWSLFGAYDWASLLTKSNDDYEPGAFDLRAPRPRPTAIAKCLPALVTRGTFNHPVLAADGWWRRPKRIFYPPVDPQDNDRQLLARMHMQPTHSRAQPVLITGATGTLGQAFKQICELRGLACRLLGRQELDIANRESVEAALQKYDPWAVINTAGYVRVDEAESDSERCFRENTFGPLNLAEACAFRHLPLVIFSSDLIFDGQKREPYIESDSPRPLNIYGWSKVEAERAVLDRHPSALVVRTSAFFGPWDEYNLVTQIRQKLRSGQTAELPSDAVVSPTYLPDLIDTCLDLLIDDETGLWHLANDGAVTWAELARRIAVLGGHSEELIQPKPLESFAYAARRPLFSALGSQRGKLMPDLEDALNRYFPARDDFEKLEAVRR